MKRRILTGMLAGILSLGTLKAQSLQLPETGAAVAMMAEHAKLEEISPLEQISAYDILPIIYSMETNTAFVVGTKKPNYESQFYADVSYVSSVGTTAGSIWMSATQEMQDKFLGGLKITTPSFATNLNVIIKDKTITDVGTVNQKGLQITFNPDSTISGFYGELKAKGKVTEYDKNNLPKTIILQVGPYIYMQTTTYDKNTITGHEAKRIDGKSLESLLAPVKP